MVASNKFLKYTYTIIGGVMVSVFLYDGDYGVAVLATLVMVFLYTITKRD